MNFESLRLFCATRYLRKPKEDPFDEEAMEKQRELMREAEMGFIGMIKRSIILMLESAYEGSGNGIHRYDKTVYNFDVRERL
jgi:hypothetical protein